MRGTTALGHEQPTLRGQAPRRAGEQGLPRRMRRRASLAGGRLHRHETPLSERAWLRGYRGGGAREGVNPWAAVPRLPLASVPFTCCQHLGVAGVAYLPWIVWAVCLPCVVKGLASVAYGFWWRVGRLPRRSRLHSAADKAPITPLNRFRSSAPHRTAPSCHGLSSSRGTRCRRRATAHRRSIACLRTA